MNENVGDRGYWNKESEGFQKIYTHNKSKIFVVLDKIFRKDMYERFEFTLEKAKPIERRKFLDVGCGNGLYSVRFASLGAEKVVGVDIADNMINLSRELAEEENVQEKCNFLRSSLLDFQPDNKFDVTVGMGLFDYIDKPLPRLVKMREITTDKVILSFPRFFTWRASIRKIRLSLKGYKVYFYKKDEVANLFLEAGFDDWEIAKIGKLHCAIGYVNKKSS